MVLPSRSQPRRPRQQRDGHHNHHRCTCHPVALGILLVVFVFFRPSNLTTPPSLEWMIHEDSKAILDAVQVRHECIRQIRNLHDAAWPELSMMMHQEVDHDKSNNKTASTVLLVNPVFHGSVGDTMRTTAEEEYLSRLGWDIAECEFNPSGNAGLVPECTDELLDEYAVEQQARIAVWHSGMTWGDMWRTEEGHPTDSWKRLLQLGYHISTMPQSLEYHDVQAEQEDSGTIQQNVLEGLDLTDLSSTKNVEQSKARITFTWRERTSYERALILYPFVKNKLVPDISFQLGPFNSTKNYWKQVDILLLLGEDLESDLDVERNDNVVRGYLAETSTGSSLDFQIVDWNDRLHMFGSEERYFDGKSIELLSLGRVVIADRLDAAILAHISGIPFIHLDRRSHILGNALSIALDGPQCDDQPLAIWSQATTLQDAVELAARMLNTYAIP